MLRPAVSYCQRTPAYSLARPPVGPDFRGWWADT